MNKIRNIVRLGFALCLAIATMGATGCGPMNLETAHKMAGETDLNKIYATAARVRNPMGQEIIGLEIHAEAKTPPVAYRRKVVTMNGGNGAAAPAAAAKYVAPATSPRGKKANIIVTPPAKQSPPATPTVVEIEEGYYPSTIPLANAGGVGTGFLQDWGDKLIGAAGMVGSAALMPGTNIAVGGAQAIAKGGNANARQSQGQTSNNLNVNQNTNRNVNNVNAVSGSSSSSSSAAGAAAASN